MEIKLTLRVRPEHNPKELKKGLGKGVIVQQEMSVDIPDNWSKERIQVGLITLQEEFLNKYCEVIIE